MAFGWNMAMLTMELTGSMDIFHHVHIELFDLLEALAKATNCKEMIAHWAGLKKCKNTEVNLKVKGSILRHVIREANP